MIEQKHGQMDRRTFLKKAVGLTAKTAAVAVGAKVVYEGVKSTRGIRIETPNGIYFPRYEEHAGNPVSKSELPNVSIDYDWYEYSLYGYPVGDVDKSTLYKEPASDICAGCCNVFGTDAPRYKTSAELFCELARREVTICFGDIHLAESLQNKLFTERMVQSTFEGLFAGPAILSRRKLLKYAGWVALAEASGYMFNDLVTVGVGIERNGRNDALNAGSRIVQRITGLLSDFRPQNLVIFYRNLIWAEKLQFMAKSQQGLGHKPTFAIQAGASHGGFEDFLTIGGDFARKLITAYPASINKELISTNNGLKEFCSIRTIKLPPEISINQIHKGNWKPVEDKVVVDKELMAALEQKQGNGRD
jgi:hypothetical protein